MERWAAKLITVFILFFSIFIPNVIPIKVADFFARQGQRGDRIISYMMCFGGGVFLSVYTLHMAPEARTIVNYSIVKPLDIHYPFADFLVVCGFIFMLFLDMAIHRYSDYRLHKSLKHAFPDDVVVISGNGVADKRPQNGICFDAAELQRLCKYKEEEDQLRSMASSQNQNRLPLFKDSADQLCTVSCVHSNDEPVHTTPIATDRSFRPPTSTSSDIGEHLKTPDAATVTINTPKADLGLSNARLRYHLREGDLVSYTCHNDYEQFQQLPSGSVHELNNNGDSTSFVTYKIDNRKTETSTTSKENDGENQLKTGNKDGGHHATRSLILLTALSLHHVFEGLSVGLKRTESDTWSLCIAIVAHEVIIAFSLGMQMVKTYEKSRQVIVAAAVCSSMVPLGVILGMILTETGQHQSRSILVANGVLQSLSTGVFIYVTFFEILQQEFGSTNSHPSLVKLLFMLAGFVCIALLALIPEDKSIIFDDSETVKTEFNIFNTTSSSDVTNL